VANPYNPMIINVPHAFKQVGKDGSLHQFQGEPWVPDMLGSHVQGIARHGDYYYLTHNNKGYSKGFLLVMDSERMIAELDTPTEHYNHPGGIQIIGDFLTMSLENSDASSSFVRFYSLQDPKRPELLSTMIVRQNKGCGAVGITSYTRGGAGYYLVAAYDNGKTDFYESNGKRLGDPELAFHEVGSDSLKNTGFSELCLVTQADGQIYGVGFWVQGDASYEDHCTLLSYDPSTRTMAFVDDRHMYTKMGGVVGIAGVHFRWGAGLALTSNTAMDFYATQRNFVGGLFYTNKFKP
jgi:hypothetical protein